MLYKACKALFSAAVKQLLVAHTYGYRRGALALLFSALFDYKYDHDQAWQQSWFEETMFGTFSGQSPHFAFTPPPSQRLPCCVTASCILSILAFCVTVT